MFSRLRRQIIFCLNTHWSPKLDWACLSYGPERKSQNSSSTFAVLFVGPCRQTLTFAVIVCSTSVIHVSRLATRCTTRNPAHTAGNMVTYVGVVIWTDSGLLLYSFYNCIILFQIILIHKYPLHCSIIYFSYPGRRWISRSLFARRY